MVYDSYPKYLKLVCNRVGKIVDDLRFVINRIYK